MGEGIVAAVTPTSAMVCHTQPGEFGEALHRLMVCGKQICHLLIELNEVTLDHAQLFPARASADGRPDAASDPH